MNATRRRRTAALLWALLPLAWAPGSRAFAGVQPGETVENAELPTLEGGSAALLGRARASVFVFFRPKQDHSLEMLKQLAGLEKEFAGKPVHFAAVVSGDWPAAEVREAVVASGIRMAVLVDRGDALYGSMGVRLHPVVGIADERWRLAAYHPFEKINQSDALRARIRRLLGEIGDAELARVLEPPRAGVEGGPAVVARRYVALARSLLQGKNAAKAVEMARKALEADAGNAAAHAVLGQALAAEGSCAEAAAAFAAALRLDPGEPAALAGRTACAGR